MEISPYAKLVFTRGASRAYAMFPLDRQGFSLHGRVLRLDGKPLTGTMPGEALQFDGDTVTVVEITFPDSQH